MARILQSKLYPPLHLTGEVVFHPRPKINRGTGQAYYPQKYVDFKRRAALELALRWKQKPTITEAVELRLILMYSKPKSRIRKKTAEQRIIRSHSRGDLDNAVKSVIDSLQDARVISNDNQVWRLSAEMWWCGVGEPPYTTIEITGTEKGSWSAVQGIV